MRIHLKQFSMTLILLLLFCAVPVNATGSFYSRFVLYDLTGGKRVKNSVHRNLKACLTAGLKYQSMECAVIWLPIPEQKPEPKENESSHVSNTCNQDGK